MIEFQTTAGPSGLAPILCGTGRDVDRPVGIRHFCVTQPGRLDADGRARRFMGSAVYPAADDAAPPARIINVLSPHTERALDFLLRDASSEEAAFLRERLPRLTLRARREASATVRAGGFPVLLFNPGGESSRAACLPLAEVLAAAGYVVLVLDGVRDSPAQVFPDGEINAPPLLPGESPIAPRVADLRFLLDCLTALHARGPLAGCLDVGRVGVLGHSRGGYLANIAAVEDDHVCAAANMDGFLWGRWTEGTGLDEYPAEFQERARALRTPILRLVGEQPNFAATREKFALESRDFGGPFWFAALRGFEHRHFASAPYLCSRPADAVAALGRMDEHRRAVEVLAPVLTAFFDAALLGKPAAERLNVRPDDFFAARVPGSGAGVA